jgi:hypothetical protein
MLRDLQQRIWSLKNPTLIYWFFPVVQTVVFFIAKSFVLQPTNVVGLATLIYVLWHVLCIAGDFVPPLLHSFNANFAPSIDKAIVSMSYHVFFAAIAVGVYVLMLRFSGL